MGEKFANLHIHTLFSDGAKTPDEIVRHVMGIHDRNLWATGKHFGEIQKQLAFEYQFNRDDLSIFALTDHDTLSGIEPMFRALEKHGYFESGREFIPGIELSLGGDLVHLTGYFPWINKDNYREELQKLLDDNPELDAYCRKRCARSAEDKLDARVKIAFKHNLDGIADFYDYDYVVKYFRDRGVEDNAKLWEECGKEGDIVDHEIPLNIL